MAGKKKITGELEVTNLIIPGYYQEGSFIEFSKGSPGITGIGMDDESDNFRLWGFNGLQPTDNIVISGTNIQNIDDPAYSLYIGDDMIMIIPLLEKLL